MTVCGGSQISITESVWDIAEYLRCPEQLRGIRGGNRLPGFIPALNGMTQHGAKLT